MRYCRLRQVGSENHWKEVMDLDSPGGIEQRHLRQLGILKVLSYGGCVVWFAGIRYSCERTQISLRTFVANSILNELTNV